MSASSARTIGSLAVTAALIGLVMTAFFGAAGGGTVEYRETAVLFEGDRAALPGVNETGVTANQSLGTAARLDGSADSYVSSETAPDTSANFTLSTRVTIANTSTTETQIVYSDPQRLLLYNGSAGEWVGVYYEPSTARTWSVSQIAGTPGTPTTVQLMLDAGTLSIIEDNSFSSTTATNDGNVTTATFTGKNLNGTLEETRVFDRPLTSSERQTLVDTPTAPLPNTQRDYRVMYDAYSVPSAFPVFFAGGDATVGDIQLVDGAAEQVTERGTDWRLDGGEVVALAGGSLDGAPVVYVQYTGEFGALIETLQSLQTVVGGALNLLALGAIVVAAAVLLKSYDSF